MEIDILKKNKYKSKKHIQKEEENDLPPYFPESVFFDILLKIPARYLYEDFRLVCKSWKTIISRRDFAAENSNKGKIELIVQGPTSSKYVYFNVKLLEMDEEKLDYKLHDLGLRRTGQVRSSCKGLILINDPKQKGVLQVMNLVTKSHITLPKCPSGCPHINCGSALGFDPFTKKYKVVHVYSDVYGFEIFTLGCSDDSWKRVPGPWEKLYERPFDMDFHWSDPVLVDEQVLHWDVTSNKYIVSMQVSDEKTHKTYLPDCGEAIDEDKYALVEMGGHLSFVYNVSDTQIDVWILEDMIGHVWFKKHSIVTELINYTTVKDSLLPNKYGIVLPSLDKLVPLGSARNGEVLVLKHESSGTCSRLYIYDMKRMELKKFKVGISDVLPLIPHRSSLLHWKTDKKL